MGSQRRGAGGGRPQPERARPAPAATTTHVPMAALTGLPTVVTSRRPVAEPAAHGPSRLISLQRSAGNRAVTGLVEGAAVQRQGGGPARPTLRVGSSGQNVGILQQKLNAAQATTPPLVIDAQFGSKTRTAVVAFQTANALAPDAVVGPRTWGALDAAHPGGGRDAGGAEVAVAGAGGANPVAIPVAGTSIHPTVGSAGTTSGPAVQECQQKLNNAGASPTVPVTGTVDGPTTTAIRNFQAAQGLPVTGQCDGATWIRLDAAGAGSTVGRVERNWRETVGGRGNIGMTSRYTWRLLPEARPDRIEVSVAINFTGLSPKLPAWFNHIRAAWNKFAAVNTVTGDIINIVFDPQQAASGGDNTVNVAQGPGRANAGQWFLQDTDEVNTIAHEWGHLVGLQDEYQQTAADYERTTGAVAPVGATRPGAGSASPSTIAFQLDRAIAGNGATASPGPDALAVVQAHNLQQGAFAQQVAAAYQRRTGRAVIDDVIALNDPNEFFIVDPFTYSSSSMMGDPGNHPSANPHDHGVQPRHVREFVEYIGQWAAQAGVPNTWEVHEQGAAATIASMVARVRAAMGGLGALVP